MVWVGAAEGLREDGPSGTKHRSANANAWGPDKRMTASPPSPSGVAIAAIVSSSIMADPKLLARASARADAGATHLVIAEARRSINMAALARPVFGVPALQEEPRFFVAFLVQVMEQRRVGLRGQLAGQFLETREVRPQVRLGLGRGRGRRQSRHRLLQFQQRLKDFLFRVGHGDIDSAIGRFHQGQTSVGVVTASCEVRLYPYRFRWIPRASKLPSLRPNDPSEPSTQEQK